MTATSSTAASADAQFETLADAFYREHLAFRPTLGVTLGLHEHDGKLGDRSGAALRVEIDRLGVARRALEELSPAALSAAHRVDREVLLGEIRTELFELTALRSPWRNPMYYMGPLDVSPYISREYAALDTRVRGIIGVAAASRRWLADARANLEEHLPRTFVDTALMQVNGTIEFLAGDVVAATAGVPAALATNLAGALMKLRAELGDFRDLLTARIATANDDYALGEAAFLRMLAETQGLTVDLPTLRRIAADDLARNLAAITAAAKRIDPTRPVRDVVLAAADDRPGVRKIIEVASAQSTAMRAFVVAHDLCSIPSDDRADVRESPPFMRWNYAFLDSPGMFETKSMPSFYYLSPPDPSWPEAEQLAYVPPTADLLFTTIHEVWPGHFLHALHIRRAASRYLKSFSTYSMVEGWAHYTEEMMWDEGAGDRDPRAHLGQLKEALLRNVRFVATIGLHTGGMTVAEATALFAEQGFVDPGNAKQQAVRGTFDPMYLSYTLGKLMIRKLRADLERTQGAAFDLKRFHDAFLSFGCAPVPVIRRELLGDASPAL